MKSLKRKCYVNEIKGLRRGSPVKRWKDQVKEYMHERGDDKKVGLLQARKKCVDRERWRLFYRGHSLVGRFQSERGIRN